MATASHIDLPTNRLQGREQSYREACQSFAVSRKLTSALKDLSNREHVDLSVTLLAAFKVLLARYSRQENIAVAMPVITGSQAQPDARETCHRTMVLRMDLSGNPTFREALVRVRDACFMAHTHDSRQSSIFEPQSDHELPDSPWHQVFFTMHKPLAQGEAVLEQGAPKPETAGFALSLFAWENR